MSDSNPIKEVMNSSTLVIRGEVVELTRPWIMGILNITPDSFYAPSRVNDAEAVLRRVGEMLEQGADIIDIGACSTRPGSSGVGAEEEIRRLEKPLEQLRKAYPDIIISIDTYHAEVAKVAIERWNADIINDASGLADPDMAETISRYGAAYVLMHTRGTADEMDDRCDYGEDVTADVVRELAFKLDKLREEGVCNVIVDPGFGFAKTTRQNFELLSHLEFFKVLECPVLAGMSRKRMARAAASLDDDESILAATTALNTISMMKGASIIRVHDVKEGVAAAKTISLCSDSE